MSATRPEDHPARVDPRSEAMGELLAETWSSGMLVLPPRDDSSPVRLPGLHRSVLPSSLSRRARGALAAAARGPVRLGVGVGARLALGPRSPRTEYAGGIETWAAQHPQVPPGTQPQPFAEAAAEVVAGAAGECAAPAHFWLPYGDPAPT